MCAICNVVGGASLVRFLDVLGSDGGMSGTFVSDRGGGYIVNIVCGEGAGTMSGGGSKGTTTPEGFVGGGGGMSGTLESVRGAGVIVKTECGTDGGTRSGGGS